MTVKCPLYDSFVTGIFYTGTLEKMGSFLCY